MPTPSNPFDPDRLQVSPHLKTEDFKRFCPSFTFNDRSIYGHDTGNGLVYPKVGDEPIQEFADRPFFWIRTSGHWVAGNLWDWIMKDGHGNCYIVHGHND